MSERVNRVSTEYIVLVRGGLVAVCNPIILHLEGGALVFQYFCILWRV